jgi:hypothetical protein
VGQVLQLRHRQATGISSEDIPSDFQPGLKRFAEKVRYEGEEPMH